MSKPRISFILPSLIGGGAEFVAKSWADELVRRGYAVDIVLLRAEELETESSDGARVIVACRTGSGRKAEYRALRGYLETSDAALVIAMMTRANLQLIRAASRMDAGRPRIAVSERNIPFAEPEHSRSHVWLRRMAYRYFYPRADLFLSISHSVGAAFGFATEMPASRLWVVPNPALGKVRTFERRPSAAGEPINLVVPGRLVNKKRPLLAIEIADRVHPNTPVESITFFGSGPMSEDLAGLERPYEIRLPGRVERWFEGLPPAAICLLPSAVEGFANVLIEAASQGVPCVVASTAFGSSDAVVPGVSGFFARTDSVEEYARAILEAQQMEVVVPRAWLDTFSLRSSTDVLERAIEASLRSER